ncbi:hypothetical protein FKM82_024886 [Ascaphus truei]
MFKHWTFLHGLYGLFFRMITLLVEICHPSRWLPLMFLFFTSFPEGLEGTLLPILSCSVTPDSRKSLTKVQSEALFGMKCLHGKFKKEDCDMRHGSSVHFWI